MSKNADIKYGRILTYPNRAGRAEAANPTNQNELADDERPIGLAGWYEDCPYIEGCRQSHLYENSRYQCHNVTSPGCHAVRLWHCDVKCRLASPAGIERAGPGDSCSRPGRGKKGGGLLLSRIALQYHRRRRA